LSQHSAARAIYRKLLPLELRLRFHQFRQQIFGFNIPRYSAEHVAQLQLILAQHPNTNGVIVFPPGLPWKPDVIQRPQQMALAFARLGYLVIYWYIGIEKGHAPGFHRVEDNLYVANVNGRVLQSISRPIVIAYTYQAMWMKHFTYPVIVYELIDHLDVFTNHPKRALLRGHRWFLKHAHVVSGVADDLVREMVASRPDTILVPNGVDYGHFAVQSNDTQGDLRHIKALNKPIIGYYGALAAWIDYDLIRYSATQMPDTSFVLIGPDYDDTLPQSKLTELPNVYWLGAKSYHDLPNYLSNFDAATLPFVVSKLTEAVSPIKIFEYMAGGKPVVTTNLPECRKYPELFVAQNADDYINLLAHAVAQGTNAELIAALRARARQNTWEMRARMLIDKFSETEPTRPIITKD
jgi:glycosyltransferase involved in cell wall biosynthesis